jgi:hypothetical protein
MAGQAPAGWYAPDAARPDHLRYWDGVAWTAYAADPTPALETRTTVARADAASTARRGMPVRRMVALGVAGTAALVLVAAMTRSDPATSPPGAPNQPTATTSGAASSPAGSTAARPSSTAPTPGRSTSPSAPATKPAVTGTALAQAQRVVVKGRAPMTGYSRALFGPAWYDVDGNGCDTRNDVLTRDLVDRTYKNACQVATGVLHDPYTGATIRFRRGVATSSAVQIDHVVALGDAWQKGAQQWSLGKRLALANDPLNLLAVSGPVNQRKGDGDTATWLPPDKSYRCAYVARQVAVKVKYGLWATAAEKAAMIRVLSTCPTLKALAAAA